MHMALCINMSRHTHIVYDDEYREVIGEVHSGDTYCCELSGIDLTGVVYFKSYSGELKYGHIKKFFDKSYELCTDYVLDAVKINGSTYKVFGFRKSAEIYLEDGTFSGKISAGCHIACRTALTEYTMPDFKCFQYMEISSGEWVRVGGLLGSSACIDTGLANGAIASALSIYGRW